MCFIIRTTCLSSASLWNAAYTSYLRLHKLPPPTPSPPRILDIPMDIPSDTPSAPSSPESSQLTCGQCPLIDFLEDSLLTSFKLNKHKTHTEKPKLTDSDFTFVKSLAGTVSTLTTDTPPTYILKASQPPHPHRELIFRKSFQDNWDRLNQRAAITFTKLTLEEYTHQAEEVERRLTKATKSAQKNIPHFKNDQELTMAHNQVECRGRAV